MMRIHEYLSPKLISFLETKTRDETIEQLVNQLEQQDVLKRPSLFLKAINEREKIVTTGIGMGVAIPHAKLPQYKDFFIVIGILQEGVDWNSLDGTPVRAVFMIGGPESKQTEYLQILSGLTLALKDEDRRKKLFAAKSPEEVLELFKEF
ncbi:MAG: PTS sugar transporter subunit IIA [Chlamydiales bacterium]